MIKNKKGITLVSLIIVVSVMAIIASTGIYVSSERFEINKYKKMINDIELLQDKVSNYYLKYGALPILRDNTNAPIQYTSTLNFEKNSADNENYYILDLEAMEGIALNYGKEGFKDPNNSDDVYIINEKSHTIYYVKGMALNGEIYHTLINISSSEDNIPPSSPQIRVISGTKNAEGIYTTPVEIEIIPGKDNWSGVIETKYSINSKTDWKTYSAPFTISENGKYTITARSYNNADADADKSNCSKEVELTLELNKILTVAEVKNVIQTTNTKVVDEYGNKITIPAGFKIRVDEGTRTKGDAKSTATHVTEGIVIEHGTDGNQFVWVPVGKIYTDKAKTEAKAETITLGRYSWNGSSPTLVQPTATNPYTSNVGITSGDYNYTEYQSTSSTSNAKARNINDFYESVVGKEGKEGNGGYYIGRYEAGKSTNTLVCKTNQTVYGDVTQPQASSLSKGMYADGYSSNGTGTFSSDLVNSYAWDTAIVFIQTFGGAAAIDYATQNASEDFGSFTTTGGTGDEYCNINDMSGNAYEWTTETYSYADSPCTHRGGLYSIYNGIAGNCTSTRARRPYHA